MESKRRNPEKMTLPGRCRLSTLAKMIRTGEFQKHFGVRPSVAAASPGRVNLIGEHIDYLDGWVLPVAIDRHLVIEADLSTTGQFEIVPVDAGFGEAVRFSREELHRRTDPAENWLNYLLGVIAGYEAEGFTVPAFRAVVHADLPTGAGLSSSAAFETATALVIEAFTGAGKETRERALLCQRAEHEYAGVPCGIMDQLAVGACRSDRALLIDCRNLDLSQVPLPPGLSLLVTNSGVKHALADGAYRQRREQCEEALKILGLRSFREVTMEKVAAAREALGDVRFRRARHTVGEMQRVLDFVEAMQGGDTLEMGRLLREGHDSLRDDFEVSCEELDFLVDAAYEAGAECGHVGSRMTGGGFGGSIISLVRSGDADRLRDRIVAAFEERYGRKPASFVTSAVDGAKVFAVESPETP